MRKNIFIKLKYEIMKKQNDISFPENLKRSSHYLIGQITGFLNCNLLVVKFFELYVFIDSIIISIGLMKYHDSWDVFIYEIKDTYSWSVVIYKMQAKEATKYFRIKRA